MSLFDIYKAKKLGINTNSMFASVAGKKLNKDAWKKGFNKWDEEWELGAINFDTGATASDSARIRSKNYCSCIGGATYYAIDPTNNNNIVLFFYDADKTYIKRSFWMGNATVEAPANAAYFKFEMGGAYGTTYKHDICINISGEHDGEYVPYNG